MEEGVVAMADKDKPEETTQKKKGLLDGSKIPLDAVLLVGVPFVAFLVLFMFVMGLLPPRPMTVTVVGATPMEEAQTPAENAPQAPRQMQMAAPPEEPAHNAATGDLPGTDPVLPGPTDSTTADAGGMGAVEEHADDAGSDVAAEHVKHTDADATGVARMERIKQLAKVYEQMNASSVAAIVTNMDENDAVDILANMKARNAAKVLASLEPEKAAALSLRLTEGGE
jgi:hypothetical protein